MSELKNSLRSRDIWVQGSRQFKDFEDYLLPLPRFATQRDQHAIGLAVETDCECYLLSIQEWLFLPISALGENFNPRNMSIYSCG